MYGTVVYFNTCTCTPPLKKEEDIIIINATNHFSFWIAMQCHTMPYHDIKLTRVRRILLHESDHQINQDLELLVGLLRHLHCSAFLQYVYV